MGAGVIVGRWSVRVSLVAVVLAGACGDTARTMPPCVVPVEVPSTRESAVLIAAGDLVDCDGGAQARTAALTGRMRPDVFLALGDLVYPNGSLDEFLDCYEPTWGRLRSITRAVVGNHEYHTAHAGPYWSYFCGVSGPPFEGYYSFTLGPWHVVVLNSNCGQDLDVPSYVPEDFGGCEADSPQARWLAADLDAHRGQCTLVAFHHPRFTTGREDDGGRMGPLWSIAQARGADVVLSGHAHLYNRFAPLDVDGRPTPDGMRSFVVGSGGHNLARSVRTRGSLEAATDSHNGVLRMELRRTSYAWQFLDGDEGDVLDRGESSCTP